MVGPHGQPPLAMKAEMESARIPVVGGKWSQSSTFFTLDGQLFSQAHPPHLPSIGPHRVPSSRLGQGLPRGMPNSSHITHAFIGSSSSF